jgi:uncharacterized protein (TIGR04255 family)
MLQGIGLRLSTAPDMPRVLFINRERTKLLQLQKDRFFHNWRKVGEGDIYPRFEQMLETFGENFHAFSSVIEELNLGPVIINQCEISYINQIVIPNHEKTFDVFSSLFGPSGFASALEGLDQPEDLRFLVRYIIPGKTGAPVGRLTVSAEPAWRIDGALIIHLTLTARGLPDSVDFSDAVDFLAQGRLHIVRAFADLTTSNMHRVWGRKQ